MGEDHPSHLQLSEQKLIQEESGMSKHLGFSNFPTSEIWR